MIGTFGPDEYTAAHTLHEKTGGVLVCNSGYQVWADLNAYHQSIWPKQ